ncbi:HAD hydrolase-like protein [Nostoc sphaeroides]|uniref:HAD family hydrolase n=1 Tax=Nostoc sphaeroides CCNUC1 TaxID=2653204 RepID=A0A5P8WEI6_9NOSO|nr:HAD hydrolase-like protein [Nostoc sphaeroides]QFS51235.1 HAD family hydrolase [Nostoc sphaeroides CCNUC1]
MQYANAMLLSADAIALQVTEQLSPSHVVMIGDRSQDMIGAKHNHLTAIGVTYGYGTEEELKLMALI